ncbi:hypothetical protein ABBQ32_003613 [Trebouxia sp. C0010 RCD-2024]
MMRSQCKYAHAQLSAKWACLACLHTATRDEAAGLHGEPITTVTQAGKSPDMVSLSSCSPHDASSMVDWRQL